MTSKKDNKYSQVYMMPVTKNIQIVKPKVLEAKRSRARIVKVGKVTIAVPGYQGWNELDQVVVEDTQGTQFVKLYSTLKPLFEIYNCLQPADLVGMKCWIKIEEMQLKDMVGPHVVEISKRG